MQCEIIIIYNYLSLIIFKVKLHSQRRIFLINEHDVECSNFFVPCKHGVTWDVKTLCGINVTSIFLINFILLLFYFISKLKYVFKMCMLMIYSVFNSNLLLIWGCNLAINKASLILRQPTLCTIVSILMGK